MKKYNVIAVDGGCIATLLSNLTMIDCPIYMEPVDRTIEVDEEAMKVTYNGFIFEFAGYREGLNGQTKVVAFIVRGVVVLVYTDTPAHAGTNSDTIIATLQRRKEETSPRANRISNLSTW